mmetsp:Transcript_26082/g.57751  ORF Transcript_26082/g.57751 Transcript_26082/m.57751 type:complete len:319 (+) Transcript_26082:46-1002(+)
MLALVLLVVVAAAAAFQCNAFLSASIRGTRLGGTRGSGIGSLKGIEGKANRGGISAISDRRETSLCAASEASEGGLVSGVRQFTASTPYALIEAAIVFGLLSAIDGGFSGDWSRNGLITTELEETIKSSVTSVGLFHLACATAAAGVTSQRAQPVLPAVLHTLLIGGLGFFRVLCQTPQTQVQFTSVADFKQGITAKLAGEYDAVAVNKQIDLLIKTNPCMVFSQSTCPFCVKAKNLLITELGATVKVVELNLDKELGYPIRAELGKRTGRTSVPSVWIGGKFVGGCNDGPMGGVMTLNRENTLVPMLVKAKALKLKK